MVARRPLKILFFIAYLLVLFGALYTRSLDFGYKLIVCGLFLVLFLVAYYAIVKFSS
jgi:hypothetical protein